MSGVRHAAIANVRSLANLRPPSLSFPRTATEIEKFHPGDPAALAFAASVKDLLKETRQVKRDWLAGALSDPDVAGTQSAPAERGVPTGTHAEPVTARDRAPPA